MGFTRASLAWSVPVAPDVLAAHLDAYAKLHSHGIKTLRLCHRYGQGEKAAITRLPVELLANIEEYLMQEIGRIALESHYAQNFKCWSGICRPHEHFFDSELESEYLNQLISYSCRHCGCAIEESPDEECDCNDCPNEYHELGDGAFQEIDNMLWDDYTDDGGHEWQMMHRENASAWWRTIYGGVRSPGTFAQHESLFLHDFGLQVWCTHTQIDEASSSCHGRLAADGNFRSTSAYLVLPNDGFMGDFSRPRNYDDEGLECEAGYAAEVAMPSRLTERDFTAFKRAYAILKLSPPEPDPQASCPVVYATNRDREARQLLQKEAEAKAAEAEPWMPKLRMLLSTRIEDVD